MVSNVELMLLQHIKFMEKCMYGLTTVGVRRLAYDLAEKLGVKHKFCPETKLAGGNWHGLWLLQVKPRTCDSTTTGHEHC